MYIYVCTLHIYICKCIYICKYIYICITYIYICIFIYKTLVVTSFCKNPDSTEEPSDHRVKRNQTISNMVYWKIAH